MQRRSEEPPLLAWCGPTWVYQLRPRRHTAQLMGHRGCERGKAIPQVLEEGMPTGEDGGRSGLLEPAHGIATLLHPEGTRAMIAFHTVVALLRGAVLHVWQDGPLGGWIPLRFTQRVTR